MNQTQKQTNETSQSLQKQLPDIGKAMISRMMDQVQAFAHLENTPLNDKEKAFAIDIVEALDKSLSERKIEWKDVEMRGLISQIKAYARLNLSIREQEIYPDIRSNGKTGKQEIALKKQYQGIEKELLHWCSKKIVRFYQDVICTGDDFETNVDFKTGLTEVVRHDKNKAIDRNNLDNITGAYKIAYIEEGDKLAQYTVEIDKDRILRAMAASPTTEKPIWKKDTARMVLKTVSWCLYKYVLRPFVNVPIELKKDFEAVGEEFNFENIKEAEITAQKEISYEANKGEVVEIKVEETPEVQETPKAEVKPTAAPF